MADIISPTLKKPTFNGTYGNFSLVSRTFEAVSVANGDKIRLTSLPVGTTVHGYRLHWDSMGSSVTLQLAIRQADGTETTLSTAHAASSAGNAQVNFMPMYIGQEGPSELIVIVGGGTATGTIAADLEAVATGY